MSSDLLSGSRPTFWNFQVIWITWQSQMPNETATGMLNPFWMVKDRKMLFSHICTTFRRSWKLLLRKIQRLPPLMSSAQVFRLVGALWSSLLLVPDYYSGDFTWKLFHSKGSGDFGFATCSRRRGEATFKVRQTNKFKKSLEIKKQSSENSILLHFFSLIGKNVSFGLFCLFFWPTRFSPKKGGGGLVKSRGSQNLGWNPIYFNEGSPNNCKVITTRWSIPI